LKGIHPNPGPILVLNVADHDGRGSIAQRIDEGVLASRPEQGVVFVLTKDRLNLAAGPQRGSARRRLKQWIVFGVGDGHRQGAIVLQNLLDDGDLFSGYRQAQGAPVAHRPSFFSR